MWGEAVFEGPPELPLEFVELLRVGRFVDALRTVFGERTDEFVALVHPSIGELMAVAETYGASLPSSLASTGS